LEFQNEPEYKRRVIRN